MVIKDLGEMLEKRFEGVTGSTDGSFMIIAIGD